MVGSLRQGWAIFAAMWILMVVGLVMTVPGERHATPAMQAAGISTAPNMEGKEVRYGTDQSSLWAVATTDASNGSVNSMHDSYKPLGMVAPMFNIAVGEVIFGGVGSGLYGMLFYVIIAVFIGGLMVGRTPEYLGKKIQARQVKIVVIAVLVPFLVVLAFTAVAVVMKSTVAGRRTPARTASARSSTPSLAGEQQRIGVRRADRERALLRRSPAASPCWSSRFVPIIAALALGGAWAQQAPCRSRRGRCEPTRRCSSGLLIGVIVIIGALTFLPGLALGPIVEHLIHGRLF